MKHSRPKFGMRRMLLLGLLSCAALAVLTQTKYGFFFLVTGAQEPAKSVRRPDIPAQPDNVLTVLNGNDAGAGSLRSIVASAAAGDTIVFDATVTTVTLTSGEVALTRNLSIDGGASGVTVTRGGSNSFRIFNISNSSIVNLRNLTVSNGSVLVSPAGVDGGGALVNNGSSLTVVSCTFTNNHMSGNGGAIRHVGPTGTLSIRNSAFTNNSAAATGGAITTSAATDINSSTISGNTSNSAGGGINFLAGASVIINSTISNNTSISSTAGGGGVRLSSDFASPGVTIINSTITNNLQSSSLGCGISRTGGTLTLQNTIVAGNRFPAGAPANDIQGAVNSASMYNLIGLNSGLTGITNGVNNNLIGSPASPLNVQLGVLANNGGPTQTHFPQSGSVAINYIPNGTNGCGAAPLNTDQRGFVPRPVGSGCEAGAVEVGAENSVSPPAIGKAFAPQTILQNTGFSTLTITIANANTTIGLTDVGVVDVFPSGMVVDPIPTATNTCGGTFSPANGDLGISLTGASIAPRSACTISVHVKGTTDGTLTNTTRNVSSSNGGTGGTATASLVVVSPTAANSSISGLITDEEGNPLSGVVVALNNGRRTITRSDGLYRFDELATGDFYTVTPLLANHSFSPSMRSVSLVGTMPNATFTGQPATVTANPLDTDMYFVREQYLDFLGREPDEGGLQYWTNEISACKGDAVCIQRRRVEVSAAFFVEQEFQQRGSFIYGLYVGSLNRKPAYGEYIADRDEIVGGILEESKTVLTQSFVQRPEFISRYQQATTAESFVDALIGNGSFDLSTEHESLIAAYNGANSIQASRAAVVKLVADNATFKQSQYNRAFVLAEYFSFLRRDTDAGGYDFWLNLLNNGELNKYRGMVCAFITSEEYQKRFSSIVTRSNADCGR